MSGEIGPGGQTYVTHPGAVRPDNEDSFLVREAEQLWAVADGMGGLQDGRWASRRLVEGLARAPLDGALERDTRSLVEAIEHANYLIFRESTIRRNRMGSTVAALIVAGSQFVALWAGDSRVYLWRGGRLSALTRDHTQVRQLVEAGYLSPEEAHHHPMSHVLARAVGVEPTLEVEQSPGALEAGDVFLLCSDGLSSVVDDDEIAGALGSAAHDGAVQGLLELALARGAPDNVTILLAEPDRSGSLAGQGGAGRAAAPVLGGAAAGVDEPAQAPRARGPPAVPPLRARRRGRPAVALAAATVVAAALALALLWPRPRAGPVSRSTALAPGAAVRTADLQRFEAALGAVPCSSLELARAAATPAGLSLLVDGVAASPAAVQAALASAAAGAGARLANVDLEGVAPATAALCTTLDAFRGLRTPTSVRGQDLKTAQDAFAVMKQADSKLAGRAILLVTPPPPPADFALVRLDSTGTLSIVAPGRAAFSALASKGVEVTGLPAPDTYRLQIDYPQPGWSSLILITGRGPFSPDLLAPPPSARGPSWGERLAAAARDGGWQVEMAWFQIIPGGGLSVVPQTQAIAPATNSASAQAGVPIRPPKLSPPAPAPETNALAAPAANATQ